MINLFDHRNFVHHFLPLNFVVNSQVNFEQMLHRVQDLAIKHIFVVMLHHIILENIEVLFFFPISGPRVPLAEPVLRKSHFGAVLPSHSELITTTQKIIVERR